MKKTVLTFGLISGAISSLLMVASLPFLHKIGFNKGLVIGYTAIVLSFLLVFFGIRSYRDNAGNGQITPQQALHNAQGQADQLLADYAADPIGFTLLHVNGG